MGLKEGCKPQMTRRQPDLLGRLQLVVPETRHLDTSAGADCCLAAAAAGSKLQTSCQAMLGLLAMLCLTLAEGSSGTAYIASLLMHICRTQPVSKHTTTTTVTITIMKARRAGG
jgi:hypothetical protein